MSSRSTLELRSKRTRTDAHALLRSRKTHLEMNMDRPVLPAEGGMTTLPLPILPAHVVSTFRTMRATRVSTQATARKPLDP